MICNQGHVRFDRFRGAKQHNRLAIPVLAVRFYFEMACDDENRLNLFNLQNKVNNVDDPNFNVFLY